MVPLVAGILAADHNPLAKEALVPDLRSVDQLDVPLDGIRAAGRLGGREGWEIQLDCLVSIDMSYIRALGNGLQIGQGAAHPDKIGDPIRAEFQAPLAEGGSQRRLAALGCLGQAGEDIFTPSMLVGQGGGGAEIGLLVQVNQELGRSLGGSLERQRVHLGLPGRRAPKRSAPHWQDQEQAQDEQGVDGFMLQRGHG